MEAPNAFYAVAVWRRHRDAFLRNWTTEAGGVFLEPLIVLGAFGYGLGQFVGEFEGDVSYAAYITPGLIAGYAMFHALFEGAYGAYLRLSMHRVFNSMLATPMQVEDLVAGEMIWGASRSVLTAIAVLVVALGFGLIESWLAVLAVPAAFLVGLVFFPMALSATAVVPSINSLNNVFTVVAVPMYFVSGIFFPVSSLPDWMEPIVWALPLTAAAHLMRGLVLGPLDMTHLYAFLALVTMAVVFGLVATALMRRRLIT
ncbi:MAG: ABC transporter permease [Chloroflexi bacterium]|nr:ABC transporter permease [Chloroflexota bacterium]